MDHHHMCDLSHANMAMPMGAAAVSRAVRSERTTIGPPLGAGVDTAPGRRERESGPGRDPGTEDI